MKTELFTREERRNQYEANRKAAIRERAEKCYSENVAAYGSEAGALRALDCRDKADAIDLLSIMG